MKRKLTVWYFLCYYLVEQYMPNFTSIILSAKEWLSNLRDEEHFTTVSPQRTDEANNETSLERHTPGQMVRDKKYQQKTYWITGKLLNN